MSPRIIHKLPPKILAVLVFGTALCLSACAGENDLIGHADPRPDPVLPTEQYAATAETQVRSMNFRVEPGLSENQRRALDQVAARAAWTNDAPVDVQIITSGDPHAIAAGRGMADYLYAHDVAAKDLTVKSAQDQASDIVTVNLVFYRAHRLNCNQSWENLTATGANHAYQNFGCTLTANLAAQVADPRDLDHPAAATSSDAGRKSTVLDNYRQGRITSAQSDDNAKANISTAIQ
jgi:pilus assembly protein CpaD